MTNKKHIPQGYKDSSLGIIPEDWEVKRLGVIGIFLKGKGVPKEKITNYGVKCLTYGDIYTKYDTVMKDVKTFISEEVAKDSQEITKGDILFAGSGETKEDIGKTVVYLDEEKACAGGDIIILKQNNLHSLWLAYYLNSSMAIAQKSKMGQGHSIVHIYPSQLERLLISLPSFREQQKIAEILSCWDEAIEKQTRMIEKLEIRKHGLMQQLLTGKKRLKGFDAKWKTEKLGNLFIERSETNFSNLPLLSIGQNGVYPQTESDKKDTSKEDKSKYKRICVGDIGYNTMRMWQGRSALSTIEGIISPAYTVVIPQEQTNALFFSFLFQLPHVIHLFWRNSQGLVNDTLNCKFKDFSVVKVNVPSFEEQASIVNIISNADEEIQKEQDKLVVMKSQKKGLIQQLLTGEKRIKH